MPSGGRSGLVVACMQAQRLADLFGADEHVEVEATWGIYQRMIAATANPTAPPAAN
jgi:hypothetical protein